MKAAIGVTQEQAGGWEEGGRPQAAPACTVLTRPSQRQPGKQPPAHTHKKPATEDGKTAFLSQNRRGGKAGALLCPAPPQRHRLSPNSACSEVPGEQQHQRLLSD